MFFSSKGVTADTGVLDSNEEECGIKLKMIKNSTRDITSATRPKSEG